MRATPKLIQTDTPNNLNRQGDSLLAYHQPSSVVILSENIESLNYCYFLKGLVPEPIKRTQTSHFILK